MFAYCLIIFIFFDFIINHSVIAPGSLQLSTTKPRIAMACLIKKALITASHRRRASNRSVQSPTALYLTYLTYLTLVSCQSADNDHHTRLITSQRPHPTASSADALPHDSELTVQTEANSSSEAALDGYPSIAHIKATLSPDHSAETLSSSTSSATDVAEAPSVATTPAVATQTSEVAGAITSVASPGTPLALATSATAATPCENLLSQASAGEETDLTTHGRTARPSLIFTGYPLAASFTLDDSAEFFQTMSQNTSEGNSPLSTGDSMNTITIKTQSMNVQFSSQLRGELMQFHPYDNAASVALEFLDDQSLAKLEYLQIHWKALIEIGTTHSTDEADLRRRLGTMLTSLLNHNVALNLNENLQLQPQELAFTNAEFLTSAIIAKATHNVVFTDLIATAPLDQMHLHSHNNVAMADLAASCTVSPSTPGTISAQAGAKPPTSMP